MSTEAKTPMTNEERRKQYELMVDEANAIFDKEISEAKVKHTKTRAALKTIFPEIISDEIVMDKELPVEDVKGSSLPSMKSGIASKRTKEFVAQYLSLPERIKNTIRLHEGKEFTAKDIKNSLNDPKVSDIRVHGILNNLSKKKWIKLVSKKTERPKRYYFDQPF